MTPLGDYDKSLTLRRQLVADGRNELLPDLATVLMNRAVTLHFLGRLADALGDYDQSLVLHRQLVADGRNESFPIWPRC
ncbi:MAG: tetratricopeptide repeat protein [Thermomicrobiales bacterium]